MNILYLGNEINGDFINEISKKDKITYSGTYTRVAEYEDIIFGGSYDVILFDVDNLIDEPNIVVEYLIRAKKVKNANIIIVALGYSYKSILIELLIKANFKNFVMGTSLSRQYEEYSNCLSGYYDKNGLDIPEEKEDKNTLYRTKIKTIGIAGVLPRIGTTTTSIQLVKYIEAQGYKAAYVEINSSCYLERCEKLYADIKRDNVKKYLIYNGVKMYMASNMGEVMSEAYNYIICDYGTVIDPAFNKVSFLEKDLNIFVAGAKANEIEFVQPMLQSQVYKEAKYIFNFVPESDKPDILEMMCEKKEDTFFNKCIFDSFDYVYNDDFKKLLPLEEITEDEEIKNNLKTQKFKLFKGFKRKDE